MRTFRVLAALTAVNTVGFAADVLFGQVWSVTLTWVLVTACIVLDVLLCRQAARHPAVSPAARSYWRTVSWGQTAFAVAMLLRVFGLDTISTPVHACGGALMVWAMLRLPLGLRSRADRTALWLDVVTVMAGATIFLWQFAVSPVMGDHEWSSGAALGAVGIMVAGMIAVFLIVKVVLTGTEFLSRRGLQYMGLSAVVGGPGSALGLLLADRPQLDVLMLVIPVAGLLAAASARQEIRDATAPTEERAGRRLRFSVLPYLAVAAVDVLLVVTAVRGGSGVLPVAVVAVALTALVILRQILAFRENTLLLDRIGRDEQRYRFLVENSTDVVTIADTDGMLTSVNPSSIRLLGRTPESMTGINIKDLVHPEDLPHALAALGPVFATPGASAVYEARLQHGDQSWRWFEMITVNRCAEPSIGGLLSNARDITETRAVQDRLRHEATHDFLTGLANRALFDDRLRALLEPGTRHELTIALIDLDGFKSVNDTYGHNAGDQLLTTVAARMEAAVRPCGTGARLGGDEFAILFDTPGPGEVVRILADIAAALSRPIPAGHRSLTARASFGTAHGVAGADPDELLRRADLAMYEAKRAGTGGHIDYRGELELRAV